MPWPTTVKPEQVKWRAVALGNDIQAVFSASEFEI